MSTASKNAQIDAKREEFRKYLEKEGVLEYLTKALVSLYEEPDKPSSAMEYLRNNFTSSDREVMRLKVDNLEKEKTQLQEKIEKLEKQKAEMKARIEELVAAASATTKAPSPTPHASDLKDSVPETKLLNNEKPVETCSDSTMPKPVEDPVQNSEPMETDGVSETIKVDEKSTPAPESPVKLTEMGDGNKEAPVGVENCPKEDLPEAEKEKTDSVVAKE